MYNAPEAKILASLAVAASASTGGIVTPTTTARQNWDLGEEEL